MIATVASLPKRQDQMLAILLDFGGASEQPALLKEMWMRHSVSPSQSAELLGRLQDKGLIRLEKRTEATLDRQGQPHRRNWSEWVVVDA